MILPVCTVILTCTGPQRVWATEPVYVSILVELLLGEELGALPPAELLVGLLVLLTTAAEEVLLVEVWYAKSSTTMVIVEASHRRIRLIGSMCAERNGSPSKAFGVDMVAGNSSGDHEAFNSVGPHGRAADEDITLGKVWNPALQCPQLARTARRRTED